MGDAESRECNEPLNALLRCADLADRPEVSRRLELKQCEAISAALSRIEEEEFTTGLQEAELEELLTTNLEYLFALFFAERDLATTRVTHLEHAAVPVTVQDPLASYCAWLSKTRRHTEFVAYELLLTALSERFAQQPLLNGDLHPSQTAKQSHRPDEAFSHLMRRLEQPLKNFIRSKVSDPDDQGTAFVETWFSVHNSCFHETRGKRFAGVCELITYVVGIAYCKCSNLLRDRYRRLEQFEQLNEHFRETMGTDEWASAPPTDAEDETVSAVRLVELATQQLIEHICSVDELPAGLCGVVFDDKEQASLLDASCRHAKMRLVTSDYYFRVNSDSMLAYRRSELAKKYGVKKASVAQYLDGYLHKDKRVLGSHETLLLKIKEKLGLSSASDER